MRGSSFKYLVHQGIVNVWLNRLMSLASVGILTACFILVGGAALLSLNLRDLFKAVENQNEMVVYVADSASEAAVEKLGQQISALEGVGEVKFVSKDEALIEQQDYMGSSGALLEGLEDDNPLPASYRVTLTDLNLLDNVQQACEVMSGVDSISAPTYLAETLNGIERVLTILGALLIGILVITSLVVISNTIRLTVFARRREINIMKYVGATNGFIRMPFIVEGVVIGLFSALLAFLVVFGVYYGLEGLLSQSSISWINSVGMIPFAKVWYWLLGGFAASGLLIGSFGSASSMRKHLRV